MLSWCDSGANRAMSLDSNAARRPASLYLWLRGNVSRFVVSCSAQTVPPPPNVAEHRRIEHGRQAAQAGTLVACTVRRAAGSQAPARLTPRPRRTAAAVTVRVLASQPPPPSAAATGRGPPPQSLSQPLRHLNLKGMALPAFAARPPPGRRPHTRAGPPPRPDSRRLAHPASRRHSSAAACTAAACTAAATAFHKMPPEDRGHSATITSRSGTPTPSVPGTVGAAAPPVPTAHERCHSTYHRHTLHQRMRCRRARRRDEPPILLPCGRHPPGEGSGRHRRGQQHVDGADRGGRRGGGGGQARLRLARVGFRGG